MRIAILVLAATAAAVPPSGLITAARAQAPVPAPASPPAAPPAGPAMNAPPGSAPASNAPAPAPLPNAPVSFAPLARQLLPAVVNISTTQGLPGGRGSGPRAEGPEVPQAPPGSPFEEFFRDFLERNRPGGRGGPGGGQRGEQQQPQRRGQSLGSGFVIDAAGYVVTNNHVINGADEINVILQDNTTIRAELVGTDERTDIALLRIRTDHRLTAVPFGNSDEAQVGDWVMAIGNPFGLGGSVTTGIVSARGRDIRQGMYDDFIQTDAAINRGNSGGPLFNMQGQVIGINTAIYSPSGGSIGIGFSIPSNLARNIVSQLRESGRVRRGWLGVNIQQMTDEIAESLGLHNNNGRGALVARAMDGGPAAAAGIQNGDVILRFDGQEVREMRNLPRTVAETPVGKTVPVVVWRNGREQTVQVTVAELPNDPQQASAGGSQPQQGPRQTELTGLGLTVAPLSPELRERFSLRPEQKGVVITEVAPNTPGAERDLRAGDVIVEVQQEPVTTPGEVSERLERLRRQNRGTALLLIEGQGGQRWVPLRLRGASGGSPG
ncbi:DegQ family serine endoprotease [Roseomonas sp. NAR14]|uniref:Probable periplasmic serine endoprotease DegP-like n=1 Tax=Roseomonas acroporae TaxID=2937791 RepID=A0A9X1YB71_9PROT|nr:DegQ family serine endoprotease [Roseomonas acroporae]MCK8786502.1 DegQ family serine endoprotease [Roseomonas acroporae]